MLMHDMSMDSNKDDTSFVDLSSIPGAVVWTMSPAGAITHISDTILQVRGITPEEALAQTPDQMLTQNSLRESLAYFEQFSRDVLAGRVPEPFHGDFEYLHKDGSIVVCEVMAVPEFDAEGVLTQLRGVSVAKG
jgi:PAS domain S-box-containing protein